MFTTTDTLQNIMHINPSLVSVLERIGVNMSIPVQTLEELALETSSDPDFITDILNVYNTNGSVDPVIFEKYPLTFFVSYIESTHRYYIDKKLPEIEQSLHDLIIKYKNSHIMLVALGNLFLQYKHKMIEHIKDEEETLIPYIKFLIEQSHEANFDSNKVSEVMRKYSIKHFLAQHNDLEEELSQTREIIVKYSPEKTIIMSYRIFLNQLELFENDLNIHAVIEEGIMIPKACMLESAILKKLN